MLVEPQSGTLLPVSFNSIFDSVVDLKNRLTGDQEREPSMDDGTIKTPNPKCRLYWCFIVYILEIQSVMLLFSTPLVNCCPSTFSNDLPHPSPLPTVKVQNTNSVLLWWWGSCVGDHILQKFNTLFLTRFRTYKINTPPQTKTPVKTTLRDWCLIVHGAISFPPPSHPPPRTISSIGFQEAYFSISRPHNTKEPLKNYLLQSK